MRARTKCYTIMYNINKYINSSLHHTIKAVFSSTRAYKF